MENRVENLKVEAARQELAGFSVHVLPIIERLIPARCFLFTSDGKRTFMRVGENGDPVEPLSVVSIIFYEGEGRQHLHVIADSNHTYPDPDEIQRHERGGAVTLFRYDRSESDETMSARFTALMERLTADAN